MPTRNKRVVEIIANTKFPIFAAFTTGEDYPDEAIVGYHKCEECKAEAIVNYTDTPACPCCAGNLVSISADTNTKFGKKDYENLSNLCECDNCGTGWKSRSETVAELNGNSIYCPFCMSKVAIKADDDSTDMSMTDSKSPSTDSSTPSDDDSSSDSDSSSDDNSDSSDSDMSEADKELDEALKRLDTKLSKDKTETPAKPSSTDDSSKDDSNTTDVTSSDDDEDSEDDSEDDENEDEEVDASDLVYHLALKNAKDINVIASNNYKYWYMFDDKSPLAIAEFENADDSVKKVFRSDDFSHSLSAAIANEGINPELMKDFGFSPIKVNLNIDDLTKKMIEEEVDNKTKLVEDKLTSLSEYFEQSVGIASVGIVKGIYSNGNDFRTSLIAKLSANNVRDADSLVDDFLATNLPNLMRETVTLAKDLMGKSPDSLQEIAAMIKDAEPRAIKKSVKPVSPPLVIHSNSNKDDRKPENSNLNKVEASLASSKGIAVVDQLFSRINTRGTLKQIGG